MSGAHSSRVLGLSFWIHSGTCGKTLPQRFHSWRSLEQRIGISPFRIGPLAVPNKYQVSPSLIIEGSCTYSVSPETDITFAPGRDESIPIAINPAATASRGRGDFPKLHFMKPPAISDPIRSDLQVGALSWDLPWCLPSLRSTVCLDYIHEQNFPGKMHLRDSGRRVARRTPSPWLVRVRSSNHPRLE